MRYGMYVLVALCIAAGVPAANAAIIASENFNDYTAGNALVGSGSAGNGFSGGWIAGDAATTDQQAIAAGSLYYKSADNAIEVGSADLAGNSVQMDSTLTIANGPQNYNRPLATNIVYNAVTQPEIWYSYLVQSTDAINSGGQKALFALKAGSTATNAANMALSAGLNPLNASPTTKQWVASIGSTSSFSNNYPTSIAPIVANTTYFVVARMWHDDTVVGKTGVPFGGFNRMAMWINPDGADTLDTPDSTSYGLSTANPVTVSTITAVDLFDYDAWTTRGYALVDNYVIGQSWGDVVPVPEPVSLALLSIGGMALLRRRQK